MNPLMSTHDLFERIRASVRLTKGKELLVNFVCRMFVRVFSILGVSTGGWSLYMTVPAF